MATVMVSFRIGEVTDSDFRRAVLCAALEKYGTRHWKDTTSFYLLETDNPIADVAGAVESAIDPAYDIALIRSLERKEAIVVGALEDDDLFLLMPYCKRG